MLTPRASEIATVQAILESGKYPDSRALAKAVVVAVADELTKRTTLGAKVALPGDDDGSLAYGPFYHQRDVNRFLERMHRFGLRADVATLYAPLGFDPGQPPSRQMCECGHLAVMHEARGCAVFIKKKQPCQCKVLNVREEGKAKWITV